MGWGSAFLKLSGLKRATFNPTLEDLTTKLPLITNIVIKHRYKAKDLTRHSNLFVRSNDEL